MGWAYYMMLRNYCFSDLHHHLRAASWPALVIILAFTAGSALVMWLGEQITEFGIGNGISMILFANIISSIPANASALMADSSVWWQIIHRLVVGIVCSLVLFIVFINDAERRIPIQYAKRVVGRKVLRRPEHQPAHQGGNVRRYAYHLRPVHLQPARYHLRLYRQDQRLVV